jgi:hypothetical protein
MIWLILIPGGALVIYLLVGSIRSQMKWDEEKEAHRRYGGRAPRK